MLEHGFATIKVDGVGYELAPTLLNISKIGSPKQIVDHFSLIRFKDNLGYVSCVNVLEACGLPSKILGGLSGFKNGKPQYVMGRIPCDDVFVLANHCMKHGVCGIGEPKGAKTKPITEFNPYQMINLAKQVLDITLTEAEQLTMTKLSMLFEALPKEKDKLSEREQQEINMLKWLEERDNGV